MTNELFVSATQLAAELGGERAPVLLDVRFSPVHGALRGEYDEAHIPGAHFVDLQRHISSIVERVHGGDAVALDEWTAVVQGWGIDDHTRVVVYGGRNGISGSYAWWALTWAGLSSVRFLDGGLEAWTRADLPTSSIPAEPGSGTFVPSSGLLPTATRAEVIAAANRGQLIDARAASKFVDSETGEPTHVPGARNVPTSGLLDKTGLVLDADDVRSVIIESGVDAVEPVVVYCGAGVASAFEVLLLRSSGIDARFFPGGWTAWSQGA